MSRIGNKLIPVPAGVEVHVEGRTVRVRGPKGVDEHALPDGISVKVGDGVVRLENDLREDRKTRALHGLLRSLLANSVHGRSTGFQRTLEVVGVGYRAEVKGAMLNLALGYSHPIEFPLPEGVTASVQDRPVRITLSGPNKETLGRTAARIRALRPPEPYKGKGVRYEGEIVRTKVGKTGLK